MDAALDATQMRAHSLSLDHPTLPASTTNAVDPEASPTTGSPFTDSSVPRSMLEKLDAELYAFVEATRPSRSAHRARMKAVRHFERIVQGIWPEATIEPFGSLATGLYLPGGDLDVVISLPTISHVPTQTIFGDIARTAVRCEFAAPESVEILAQTRVPILKFKTNSDLGGLKLDVSLEHARDGPLGATACLEILRGLDSTLDMTTRSDRAKGLVFVVKEMLRAQKLGSTRDGGIGGMATFCLVVSFVQHDQREEEICTPASDLLAFLGFAARFDYEHNAITVAGKGSIVPKSTQRWTDDSKPHRICIQHPTDLDRNLSAGTYKLYELQAAFQNAHDSLLSLLDSPVFPPSSGQSFLAEIFSRPFELAANLGAPFFLRTPSPARSQAE